ncbi:MAG: hypothetical protein ACOC1G_09310, partial [Phycisphaeraceae bacterium]
AVVRRGTQPVVFVREDGAYVPRPVSLGMDNNRVVRVTEGLQTGDVVSLAPPLDNDDNGDDDDDEQRDNDAPAEAERQNAPRPGNAPRGENRS